MSPCSAIWANTLNDIVSSHCDVSIRQIHFRDRHILEAKSDMASLAMKMHVCVIIMSLVMTSAQLIFSTFAIINHMHQSMFLEQRQSAKYS